MASVEDAASVLEQFVQDGTLSLDIIYCWQSND